MTTDEPDHAEHWRAAALVHLSGPKRGVTEALDGDAAIMVAVPGGGVELAAPDGDSRDRIAVLERRGQTYRLVSGPGAGAWVNGERIDELVLASGDVVELGNGAVLRFRLYPPGRGRHKTKTMTEAFSDCIDCARYGADTPLARAGVFVSRVGPELASTTPRVRLALAALMLLAVALSGAALVRSLGVESKLEVAATRVEGLARMLERSDDRTVGAEELATIRAEIDLLKVADARLEDRPADRAGLIARAAGAVVFLQGAYGFVEPESGRWLSIVVDSDGRPVSSPGGQPAVALGGDGPELEILYTGTGFVATADGRVVTNRHVAEPWLFDGQAQALSAQGLRPVMRRFIGYLPGLAESFDVVLAAASETADVAVLRCGAPTASLAPLALDARALAPGEEITVLGYPTGIRAMIARSQRAVLPVLEARGEVDFWEVAKVLAAGGHIRPLATSGIVGQVNSDSVVYDAGTTHGGSGGPVIDVRGNVVAVNSAIMPDFAGANLGVPASEALRLVESAGP